MPARPRSPRVRISRLINTSIMVNPLDLSIGAVPIAVVVCRYVDTSAEVDVDTAHRHTPWCRRIGEIDVQRDRARGQTAAARIGQRLRARRAARALDLQIAQGAVRREYR